MHVCGSPALYSVSIVSVESAVSVRVNQIKSEGRPRDPLRPTISSPPYCSDSLFELVPLRSSSTVFNKPMQTCVPSGRAETAVSNCTSQRPKLQLNGRDFSFQLLTVCHGSWLGMNTVLFPFVSCAKVGLFLRATETRYYYCQTYCSFC